MLNVQRVQCCCLWIPHNMVPKYKKDIEPEMLHRSALIRSLLIQGKRSFISRNSGNQVRSLTVHHRGSQLILMSFVLQLSKQPVITVSLRLFHFHVFFPDAGLCGLVTCEGLVSTLCLHISLVLVPSTLCPHCFVCSVGLELTLPIQPSPHQHHSFHVLAQLPPTAQTCLQMCLFLELILPVMKVPLPEKNSFSSGQL